MYKSNINTHLFKIILIIFLSFNINLCIAKNIYTKTEYFVAKNYFSMKYYDFSFQLFNKIIQENPSYSSYVLKSKIYIILINTLQKNYSDARSKIKNFKFLYNKDIYLDYIFYIKSYILLNIDKNNFQKLFITNRFNKDLTYINKSLVLLNKINNNLKFKKKINPIIKTINNNILKSKIDIARFYLNNDVYISVINRMFHIDENFLMYNEYDYERMYIILKSYNELFLDNISSDILNFLKKQIL
jgi:outer membrane protein assembly factor BamD (BamD/ComL family)